ncbi:MAG: hypothetical protein ACI4VB_06575 [Bradymonadia bacterium]
MTTTIVNAGNLFAADAVEKLAASDLFTSEEIAEKFEQLCEHFERHHVHLNDEATAPQVGFFLVNRALHILGYAHSHNEPLGEDLRIEYTLFNSANAFLAHVSGRGTHAFFNGACGIGKLAAWAANLDEAVKDDEGNAGDPPAYELDEQMRATNLQWAILTNGRIWRLFHKNTCAMLNTFFEIDLLQILETRDVDAFKIFLNAFSVKAIAFDKSGSCPDKKLLA